MKVKAVAKGIFTFTLSTGASTLYLGGVNPQAGKPTYVSIDTSQGFWAATSKINGASISSIVDTGTTLIIAPTDYAKDLFDSLKDVDTFTEGDTLYGTYDCDNPPTVTYAFGRFSTAMSDDTLKFGQTQSGQCIMSIIGYDTGFNAVIAGDSFLQNVHAVFDRDSDRMGFSKQ